MKVKEVHSDLTKNFEVAQSSRKKSFPQLLRKHSSVPLDQKGPKNNKEVILKTRSGKGLSFAENLKPKFQEKLKWQLEITVLIIS